MGSPHQVVVSVTLSSTLAHSLVSESVPPEQSRAKQNVCEGVQTPPI